MDGHSDAPSGGCVTILFIFAFFAMVGLWLMSKKAHSSDICPPRVDTATCTELLGPDDER